MMTALQCLQGKGGHSPGAPSCDAALAVVFAVDAAPGEWEVPQRFGMKIAFFSVLNDVTSHGYSTQETKAIRQTLKESYNGEKTHF